MIQRELLNPKSIVIVGASNDVTKPGGKVLKNIIDGNYSGNLIAINPKEATIQGVKCYKDKADIPNTDLAIIAIAAKYVPETMEFLAREKGTRAFTVLSAGFAEADEEGKKLEKQILDIVNKYECSLIGPNCMGVLTSYYHGFFGNPIPKLAPQGVDFVTGSGATAVFFLESAIPMGITFSSIYSVGNSAQIGVEEVLKYWDETFDPNTSSKIKLIYIEKLDNPPVFLKHAKSLIQKGCRIAAIKAGTTDAGSRAVSSHTGAMAGSDAAIDALFRKCGIIRCFGREELAYVTAILTYKELKGNRLAVITHAGGPGVMATDKLSKEGMQVPHLDNEASKELSSKLFHGAAVGNPIDFLATGTAEQLGLILDYADNKFDEIDGSVVIFGTPGLFDITDAMTVLNEKIKTCKKPIFPMLPSIIQAGKEVNYFKSLGNVCVGDEVQLASAIAKVYFTPKPAPDFKLPSINEIKIREIIKNAPNGYLKPNQVKDFLEAANIPTVPEKMCYNLDEAVNFASEIGYPIVMKVVGPVHKSDIGGVKLSIMTADEVKNSFNELMKIDGSEAVLIQKMLASGLELFMGAKMENKYGHIILCGLGGIFIEVLKDVASGLAPLSKDEALKMIQSLKSYKMIQGVRGKAGTDENVFAEIMVKLSALLAVAPEIAEMDINPLIANGNVITAVDARIKIEK